MSATASQGVAGLSRELDAFLTDRALSLREAGGVLGVSYSALRMVHDAKDVVYDVGKKIEAALKREAAIDAAAKASPVIPATKCELCGGKGQWLTWPYRLGDCPDCHGTGVAEVIPVAVLREFIEFERELLPPPHDRTDVGEAHARALDKFAALLDEHTRTKPQTNERTTR